jgi:hypothetical protein
MRLAGVSERHCDGFNTGSNRFTSAFDSRPNRVLLGWSARSCTSTQLHRSILEFCRLFFGRSCWQSDAPNKTACVQRLAHSVSPVTTRRKSASWPRILHGTPANWRVPG